MHAPHAGGPVSTPHTHLLKARRPGAGGPGRKPRPFPPPLPHKRAGLVLVVSPLLALMRDQLDHLPAGLPGAMLWGGQTRAEGEDVLAQVGAHQCF